MAALEDLRALTTTEWWRRGPVVLIMRDGNHHVVASAHVPDIDLVPGTGLAEVKLLVKDDHGHTHETDAVIDYVRIEGAYRYWW